MTITPTLSSLALWQWHIEAMPGCTARTVALKLTIEAKELLDATDGNSTDPNECADVFLCLLILLGYCGISFEELIEAADAKMKVNRGRTWQKLEDGTYQHT